ncbi:hypothetical protein AC1031_014544 [Aphanomyces cochlioides]|nr:hypothetical protein AC1031_014544 [Aphanomyces cochlioides]
MDEIFFNAIQAYDMTKVKTLLLDAGFDVNTQCTMAWMNLDGTTSPWTCTALMYASRGGLESMVQLLLAHDSIDVNIQDFDV